MGSGAPSQPFAILGAMPSRILPAMACALLPGAAGRQAHPPSKLPWEITSVKPMLAKDCKEGEGGVHFLPNGLSAECVPPVFVVEFAYQLMDPSRILGLPKWAAGPQLFAMDARVSAEDAGAFARLKREEKAGMMQSVLAERFAMKAHTEARPMPAYALIVAKNGPKLKQPSDTATGYSQFGGSTGEVKWANSPLTDLKFLLAKETGRPVVDKTGLAGKYDFTLEYTPADRATTDGSGRPSIYTALEEQLGLKLVPIKQPVEVLVIDSFQQPTEN